MKLLRGILDSCEKHFSKGGILSKLYPLYEAADSFLYTPGKTTESYPHVRDKNDIKRVISSVVIALIPCTLLGVFNIGFQALKLQGLEPQFLLCLFEGAKTFLPIVIVSYAVGGFWEVLFAVIRKHEINEGFFVTGLLFPLVLSPSIPLWQVALGISFGVVIGKEVFGGTGMNILNPALVGRAFIFFAYPGNLSGDRVWTTLDGVSRATPLLAASSAERGQDAVSAISQSGFNWQDMFIGLIPGSIGETSALACIIGAVILLVLGVASYRIMAGMLIGGLLTTIVLNMFAGPERIAFLSLPFHYHLVSGGFAFGLVFMATDPVSAARTAKGQWIYGVLIGLLAILIRTINPAYPEGVMLAILFMNVFAPTIDHFIIKANIQKRLKRYGSR